MRVRASGKGAHEIRHYILFFVRLSGIFGKSIQKLFEYSLIRLAHQGQDVGADMLRRDFELASGKFGGIGLKRLLVMHCHVKTHPACNAHAAYSPQSGHIPQEEDALSLIHEKRRARARRQATGSDAFAWIGSANAAPHVGAWTANVTDGDARFGSPSARDNRDQFFGFTQYRFAAPGYNATSLVQGERAERASAAATSVRGYARAQHLLRGDRVAG